MFDDVDTIFLHYIGNWKKAKRQDVKDIYKCNDCEAKLEVERKGTSFKVKLLGPGEHSWSDSKHTETFKKNGNV